MRCSPQLGHLALELHALQPAFVRLRSRLRCALLIDVYRIRQAADDQPARDLREQRHRNGNVRRQRSADRQEQLAGERTQRDRREQQQMPGHVRRGPQTGGDRDRDEKASADCRQIEKIVQPAAQDIRQGPDVVQLGLEQKLGGKDENDRARDQRAAQQRRPGDQARDSRPAIAAEQIAQAHAELHRARF
jgi:hypothetical protein